MSTSASTSRSTVTTPLAPAAIGPYSQATVSDGWIYCSGQIPMDPASGELVEGDVSAQTERVLTNLRAVLQAAGGDLDTVLKTTVFLADMEDFGAMNEVYARPARQAVEVSALPRNARVEISCIAVR